MSALDKRHRTRKGGATAKHSPIPNSTYMSIFSLYNGQSNGLSIIMPKRRRTTPVFETIKMTTESTCSGIDPAPVPVRTSPYTEPPIQVYIGADRIVHFVPRHLVPPNWKQCGFDLPNLEAEIGHILVHFLYTGLYETLEIDPEPTSLQLRRALGVFVAANTYALRELQELASREMERHAENLDIPAIFEAIGPDFEKLPAESWVHAYLDRKIATAFGEDFTGFPIDEIFKRLNDISLMRFGTMKILLLFQRKIIRMVETVNTLATHERVYEPEVTAHNSISPLKDSYTIRGSASSTASSPASEDCASKSEGSVCWSGDTCTDLSDVNIKHDASEDANPTFDSPTDDGWEDVLDNGRTRRDIPTISLTTCSDSQSQGTEHK